MSRVWSRPLLATLGIVLAALVGGGCSRGGSRPEVAAVVEGAAIAASETEALVDVYLQRQKDPGQAPDLPRRDVAKLVLEYQIKLAFANHLAKEVGVSVDPATFDIAADVLGPEQYQAVGMRKEDFVRELEAARLSKAMGERLFPNVAVTEDEVREEYLRRAAGLERTWKLRAQVAYFGTEEAAQRLRTRVQDGEAFDATAAALGAETVSAVDLNPLATQLPPGVLGALEHLRAGQVSEAIPVGIGAVVVLAEDRQDLPKVGVEDLRGELTEIVADRKRSRLFEEWFEKKFAQAKIKVDPYYGTWNSASTSVT